MSRRDQLLAGAVATVALLIGAVAVGTLSPGPEAAALHVSVGACEAGQTRVPFVALLQPELQQLATVDAGPSYWKGAVYAWPLDGGHDPGGAVVPGAYIVWAEPSDRVCTGVEPALEMWMLGRTDAPWDCACSSGADCAWAQPVASLDGGRWTLSTVDAGAPVGRNLGPGSWAGSGCVRRPCKELLGTPAWPAQCPRSP